jgi:hypothetical protein
MGGSLEWSTTALPRLAYYAQVSADAGECISGHAVADLDAETNPVVFRIDAEQSDVLPMIFDVRIIPTLCVDAIVEPSTGTAQGTIEARYFVKLNGAVLTQDSLFRQLGASVPVSFPGGASNTIVIPDRHVGDEITISARFRVEATSTGAGVVRLSLCNWMIPARLAVEVTLLDVATNSQPPVSPSTLALHGAAPNPFNPQTTISYSIPAGGPVRLTIHDVRGRLVATLIDRALPPGNLSTPWDGRDGRGNALPAGAYIARLTMGGESRARRLVMVK